MNDVDRLKDMIAKLRERERAPGDPRSLRGGDARALLGAILQEADETILSRRLWFLKEGRAPLALGVANRRVQGVLGPAPAGLKDFENKPLKDPDEDWVVSLKDGLLVHLGDGGSLAIRSERLEADDMGSDAGIAATSLIRAWGLEPSASVGATPGDRLAAFLKSIGGEAEAWLRIEGEDMVEQAGEGDALTRLEETAAQFLDAYLNRREALFGAADTPRCVAVGGAGSGLFFADAEGHSAFVLTRPGGLSGAADAWRQAFG